MQWAGARVKNPLHLLAFMSGVRPESHRCIPVSTGMEVFTRLWLMVEKFFKPGNKKADFVIHLRTPLNFLSEKLTAGVPTQKITR